MIPDLPINETARLSALENYGILSNEQEHNFDDLTRLAAEICHTPIALVTILGQEKQWFISKFGTQLLGTSKEIAFCAHAIAQKCDIMVVNDARADERFHDNPLVTGDLNVVFYAGVPLINPEGYALGTICVIDHEVKDLTQTQIDALKILGKQALHQLELRKKLKELEHANGALAEANSFIEKFARRAAHDIKNPLTSIIISADSLQKKLIEDGDERSLRLVNIALRSARNLVTYVNDMLDYSKAPSILLASQEKFELGELVEKILLMLNIPDGYKVNFPRDVEIKSSKIAMEQILLNLFSNAIRYNDKPDPEIDLVFTEDADKYNIVLSDNGIGIPKSDLEKIFQEGYTSIEKDRFNKKGNGLGLDAVSCLIKKMHGKISANSDLGVGTVISFSLPK